MQNSVYEINKGVNKAIEFKGLKAQYIWYVAGSVMLLFVLYALMYMIGINHLVCIGVIAIVGTFTIMFIYRLNNTYGEYGLMKLYAQRRVPKVIKCRSRLIFRDPKGAREEL